MNDTYIPYAVSEETLKGLRDLRKRQWKTVIYHRQRQERMERRAAECHDEFTRNTHLKFAEDSKAIANTCLKDVQILNDFFPIGDYAVLDVAKDQSEWKGVR